MEIYRKGKITVDSEMIMEQLLLNSEACGVLFEKVKRLEAVERMIEMVLVGESKNG